MKCPKCKKEMYRVGYCDGEEIYLHFICDWCDLMRDICYPYYWPKWVSDSFVESQGFKIE